VPGNIQANIDLLLDAAAEALGETVNTTTSARFFLLTSVERVAKCTYVNVEALAQG
jgi:hypothetical protein